MTVRQILAGSNPISDVSVACASAPGTVNFIEFGTNFGDLPELVITSTALSSPTVSVAEDVKGRKEDSECSEKGICDRATGICKCFSGYTTSDGYGNPGLRGDCGRMAAY